MAPQRAAVVVRRCSLTLGIITPASIQTLPVVVWPRAPLAARPCVSLVCARECVRPKIRHDARHARKGGGSRHSEVGRRASGVRTPFHASLRAVSASTTALLITHTQTTPPCFPRAALAAPPRGVPTAAAPRGGGDLMLLHLSKRDKTDNRCKQYKHARAGENHGGPSPVQTS